MNKKKISVVVSCVLLLAVLTAVGGKNSPMDSFKGEEQPNFSKGITIEDEPVALASAPTATGKVEFTGGDVLLDASNTSQGYVMMKYSGDNKKIKVQIALKAGTVYTYNLNARNAYEVFPLTEGDGTYSIKVFENVSGTKYSQAFSKDVAVKLVNQYAPFLYANQYVNFTDSSATVKKGKEVTKSATDDLKKVELIYKFVVDNITYDTAKASSVQSGYLPNIDSVLASKKGICFDYAAVMVAMLRSQDIPSKLVVGYTGDVYHAWINVYTPSTGWVDGMILFDGKKWQLMDPTFASSGKKSESIMKYIGDGKNYTAKYAY